MRSELCNHPAFTTRAETLSYEERVRLVYQRLDALLEIYKYALDDVETLSPKFWEPYKDPALVIDVGCANVLACHLNLFLGTILPMKSERPDLLPIMQQILEGEVIGNFLLTELGHGLDITRLETTATKVTDGYILHTPHGGAAKFMPPTTPHPTRAKISVVFARLLVDGEDRGVHPFLVPTSDEHGMCLGISATILPPRSGTSPLDYSLTSFDHVRLPPAAFLGSALDAPADRHALLLRYIWRTTVGQASLSLIAITGTKIAACLGVEYSLRRMVQGKQHVPTPVMGFRTQQLPMVYCTAVAHVLDAWAPRVIEQFVRTDIDVEVRGGLAAVLKTTVCRFATHYYREVGERLGVQGTFGHNIVSQIEMDMRGFIIAEGDIRVLSIRLFSQMLQGRVALPMPSHGDSVLAQHSAGLLVRCQRLLAGLELGHRDPRFNDLILPQCEPGILALGCAYAYGAAVDAGVPQPLLDLFELAAMKWDPSWYSENTSLSDEVRLLREDLAVLAALPHIRAYVDALGVRDSISAPILSDEAWQNWTRQLRSYVGGATRDKISLTGVPTDDSKARL